MVTTNQIFGAVVSPAPMPEQYLQWLDGARQPDGLAFTPTWAFAICDDGVTWGRLVDNRWDMGNEHYPDLCPGVTAMDLQELRLFGDIGELMIWRVQDGFAGRVLTDNQLPDTKYLQPFDEEQVLIGTRVLQNDGAFTRVTNSAGLEQALPLSAGDASTVFRQSPFRLLVRHYLEQDKDTGVVRVAVSRLVNLKEVDK